MVGWMAALIFFAFLAQSGAGRLETLVLPHALRPGETAWLEVTVGAIPHDAEIEIAATSGRLLGVISPYAVRSGNEAGTYPVPLPPEAISNDRVSVRLSFHHSGLSRAPTQQEVKSIRLKIATAAGRPTPKD
jgi:hypothetical protein